MKRLLVSSILLIMLLTATSYSFDGMRKGFVLGGGAGFCPTATWSYDFGSSTFDDQGTGFGINFIIGYAWDEQNMIVYEGNIAGYSTQFGILPDARIYQGFNGASFYHYFGPVGNSFFGMAGLGFYIFQVEEADANPSIGFLVGGGYEFIKHVQAGVYFSYGQTSDPYLDNLKHMHISILINAVAF
jgi:hypothetical protein